MVIDTRNNEPELMNARTWRARKGSMEVKTGRLWHYHGMDHKAMRTRTYVLQKFWRDHISDKNGRRGNMPLDALAVPKTTFSLRDDCNGQGGRMERRRMGWNRHSRLVCEFTLSKDVLCDGRGRPTSGSEANAPDYHGVRELGM